MVTRTVAACGTREVKAVNDMSQEESIGRYRSWLLAGYRMTSKCVLSRDPQEGSMLCKLAASDSLFLG